MQEPRSAERLTTGPNLLTLSRLGWAVVLFVCIDLEYWLAALIVFGIAALSDWLDGVWARHTNQLSALGRNLDPLIDKVLIGGAFIFLLPVPDSGLEAWMVTLILGRELLITGLRGLVEAAGKSFGAGPFGKVKMILQCVALVMILTSLWQPTWPLDWPRWFAIWLMLIATAGSGVEYLWRASRVATTRTPITPTPASHQPDVKSIR